MSTTAGTTTPTSTTDKPTPPYNFYLALSTIVLSAVIFGVVMYIYKDTFEDGALVTTALSVLFGIFGTVVGAFFGIKSTSDTIDKGRSDLAEANNKARQALAALPADDGKKIMGIEP